MQKIVLLLSFLFPLAVSSQVLERPNVGLSSHEALELDRIEHTGGRTLLYLTIENNRLGGGFCMNTNTFLRNSLGEQEYKLIEMGNLPACPDRYRFRSIGEKRSFVLHFSAIARDIQYLDLVEECGDACVSLKYICLDTEINRRINEGLTLYRASRPYQALKHFQAILEEKNDNYSPVFGTLYLYLITVSFDMGDSKELRRWYDELKSSSVVNRDEIIKAVREEELVR